MALLIWLTRMLGFARAPRIADAGLAARLVPDALPGFQPADVALSRDGAAALVAAGDGRVALVRPLGDRFVVRTLSASDVARSGGVLRVRPAEAMFPETAIDLGDAALGWARRL
ncbi:MAG: hypothetical protein MUE77_00995 [Sandarakinorhabdus sp.]|nr:hypothetical protein [Sandarakinorhabdus sp.]